MNCDCVKFVGSLIEKYQSQNVKIFNDIHKDFYRCLTPDDKKLFKIVYRKHTIECLNKEFVDCDFCRIHGHYELERPAS